MAMPDPPAAPEEPTPVSDDATSDASGDAAREVDSDGQGPRPHPPAEALALFVGCLFVFWLLHRIEAFKGTVVGDLLPAVRVLVWIAPAYWLVLRRGQDPLVQHAALGRPRALGSAIGISLGILVVFAVGFGWREGGWPPHPVRWIELWHNVAFGLVFTALHEEYFFRGVLQPSLDRPEGPRFRLLGAPFGRGAIAAAALFALAHFALEPDPRRLAVFFPAIWFAWLRARTGSIWPPVVAHALANSLQFALRDGYGLT